MVGAPLQPLDERGKPTIDTYEFIPFSGRAENVCQTRSQDSGSRRFQGSNDELCGVV